MKKTIIADGNEACSYTSYMFTETAGIYPITPSSQMAEKIDQWSKDRINQFGEKVRVVEMQSEAGAAGFVHGSLKAGCLTTTFTASQGLLLMIPNMYKISGEMLPGVFHVSARSLSTHALSIFGDHQDVYACRATGFAMLASSSVQDAAYMSGVAHLSAIKASLPFMHFFDGFRTSHELQKIEVLQASDYADLIDYEALNSFRNKALNPLKPNTYGTAQNDDIYFQATEARNIYYNNLADTVAEYMNKINEKAGTNYKPFNYYGNPNAKRVIVAMGSVCETIKETIDSLNEDIGLLEVHLYRPFSDKYLKEVLPASVEKIAVLDRTKEPGSNGEPLYLDIVAALKGMNIVITGGRYGLSSKNTTPAQIYAVYEMLKDPKDKFVIGIEDDVTNLSLTPITIKTTDAHEWLLYGYGSDGMVGASKSIIKMIGDNTDDYVQGYFQYDSKKSGGVTASHLRFSNKPIRSTYYVEKPSFVVITKDSYLRDYELLDDIADGASLVINTIKNDEEIMDLMRDSFKKKLIDNHVKVYVIDAYKLAANVGLKNKISTVMTSAILKLSGVIDYELALTAMRKEIEYLFSKKGREIVEANFKAIEGVSEHLRELVIPANNYSDEKRKYSNIIETILHREGNYLKTSDFVNRADGVFESGTSVIEKRRISDTTPDWISENCIQCNQCSMVCPHAVIRPYLLSDEEFNRAPEYIQSKVVPAVGADGRYILSTSVADCTGCSVCVKVCPGKKGEKALAMGDYSSKEQEVFDYLDKNISVKKGLSPYTVKGSQFKTPKFVFSGACAGCGETAYIKLLTQLYGEHLIVANATGCTSIYGASAPSTPYTVPWASSLFEDNAEYGYGMQIANDFLKNKIARLMEENMTNSNAALFQKWLESPKSYENTKNVYDSLNDDLPKELAELKDNIVHRNVWCIGGDGWAYDIGFSGIDHVLSSKDNIKILVLDSQVYSNTGGQSSKASPKGSIASFTASGKTNNKKDLARIAMCYPHAYVAQVSMGANQQQTIKAFQEANEYDGPAIIIAYSPCIAHGIKGGMENSIDMGALATKSGYFPIFRYHPENGFTLDSKNVDFELYEEFLNSQTRYSMLKTVNPDRAERLLIENKDHAKISFNFYEELGKKTE